MVIGVFSHDPGGAEVLSSYIKKRKISPVYCVSGPAIKIFKKKLNIKKNLSFNEVLKISSSIICSTSGLSDLEYRAINEANQKGLKSIAILDHWINYKERFIRNNKRVIPDEIWVTDKYALEKSKKLFKKSKLKLIKNYYFLDLKKKYEKIKTYNKKSSSHKSLLYLCEPIANHCFVHFGNKNYYGYNEFDSMIYFFENAMKVFKKIEKIIVRLHPSESQKKYDKIINKYKKMYDIYTSKNNDLFKEINKSHIVLGCESMPMYFAKKLKKRVVSVIPPNGKKSSLPFSNIEYIKDLL